MEQERCYVCRTLISEGALYRRVMPTAQYTGGNLGVASGVFSFTRAEVVSLCAACDAAEALRTVWRPGVGLKTVAVVFVVTFCLSAFLNGYWWLGGICTAVVLWRLRVRWQRRHTSSATLLPTRPVASPPSASAAYPRRLSRWASDETEREED
jgi:hypothetical protein